MRKKCDSQTLDEVIASREKANTAWDRYLFSCIQSGEVSKEFLFFYMDTCNKWEQEYQTQRFREEERKRAVRDLTEAALTY